ncbi:hypothetical protein NA57DRAFT_57275 [Rhizodiscina lignyota]|uniref:Uncharacterized protein n=1 Tax=Rhizodiscina lignyota TaxID=1504668 RepID=A0A9P4M9T6_9PEZI|nr:hypothetical protein NA57DRAFT_57275 [Rhizodiscina lignyota]
MLESTVAQGKSQEMSSKLVDHDTPANLTADLPTAPQTAAYDPLLEYDNSAQNKDSLRVARSGKACQRLLLLLFIITIVMGGLGATTLALAFKYRDAAADGTWYLTGLEGTVFLLLGSLSVLFGAVLLLAVRELSIHVPSWKLLEKKSSGNSRRRPEQGNPGSSQHDFLQCSGTRIHPKSLIAFGILILVVLAGTIWLHFSIKISDILDKQSAIDPSRSLGRAISPDCSQAATTDSSFEVSLNQRFCASRMDIVMNDTEAYQTAAGTSSSNSLLTIPNAYQGMDIAVLADPAASSRGTFIASTLGISTACSPRYQPCHANVTDRTYTCSEPPFSGKITQPLTMSEPNAQTGSSSTTFDAAFLLKGSDGAFKYRNIPDSFSVSPDGSALLSILSCRTTALEVTYFSGSGARAAISMKPVSQQTSNLILSPIFPSQVNGYDAFGWDLIVSGMANSASTGLTQKPQALAISFANAFSHIAIASAVGITTPSSSTAAGSRSVTLLPVAPILMIVAADFAFAILGMVLGITAVVLVLRGNRVDKARRGSVTHPRPQTSNSMSTAVSTEEYALEDMKTKERGLAAQNLDQNRGGRDDDVGKMPIGTCNFLQRGKDRIGVHESKASGKATISTKKQLNIAARRKEILITAANMSDHDMNQTRRPRGSYARAASGSSKVRKDVSALLPPSALCEKAAVGALGV